MVIPMPLPSGDHGGEGSSNIDDFFEWAVSIVADASLLGLAYYLIYTLDGLDLTIDKFCFQVQARLTPREIVAAWDMIQSLASNERAIEICLLILQTALGASFMFVCAEIIVGDGHADRWNLMRVMPTRISRCACAGANVSGAHRRPEKLSRNHVRPNSYSSQEAPGVQQRLKNLGSGTGHGNGLAVNIPMRTWPHVLMSGVAHSSCVWQASFTRSHCRQVEMCTCMRSRCATPSHMYV